MKNTTAPLHSGVYYHIYNRGNNRENLFIEQRNYSYFLNLYMRYIEPVAETFAYCLMKNHFHLLVRIREKTSQVSETCEVAKFNPSQAFSNLFNAYAKAINKSYGRTGSLFEERFGRIPVTSSSYFENLIFYIHFNPQKHGFLDDYRDWPWSSYPALTGVGATRLQRQAVWEIFGSRASVEEFHQGMVDEKLLTAVIDDEFEAAAEDLTGL